VEPEISEQRRVFAQEASKVLFTRSEVLETRKLAELGKSLRVLTIHELALLESQNRLPQWFVGELGLTETFVPSKNFDTRLIFSGHEYHCKPPHVLSASFVPRGFQQTGGRSPDVRLISGKDGKFLLQNFLRAAFLSDGYIPAMTDAHNSWGWQLMKDRPSCHLAGRTFLCVVEGSVVFTHWLMDTLPRFQALNEYGIDCRQFDNILFAATKSEFCKESLAVLGIDPRRVCSRLETGVLVSCDEFCHVTSVRNQFFADSWLYECLNRTFGPASGPSRSGKRIYISRSLARRRRLLNEETLYPILARNGFEIVHAERLGLRAMAALCSEASHVVAPHGAGLSNIVFLPRDGTILEPSARTSATSIGAFATSSAIAISVSRGRTEALSHLPRQTSALLPFSNGMQQTSRSAKKCLPMHSRRLSTSDLDS
jgi:capsular polysaccharide biosynthesis protein